jgi:hypothetical protein
VDLVTVDLEDAHSSSHLTDSEELFGGRLEAVLPTLTNIFRPVYTALQAMEKVNLRQNTAYVKSTSNTCYRRQKVIIMNPVLYISADAILYISCG